MTALYDLTTTGPVPVSLADMKTFMKVTSSADDALITEMLSAATAWGENYTGREFRANTWTLLLDEFEARINIRRSPVNTVTSVQHLVAAVLVTVATSVYYLKNSTQFAEILLDDGQSWPTDTDNREQVVQIVFVTKTYYRVDEIATAIKRHVAYWHKNRGDCTAGASSGGCSCGDAAMGAGMTSIYDQFRIPRV